MRARRAYDAEIENPAFTGSPKITITRMVEEDDVVMAEMTLEGDIAAPAPVAFRWLCQLKIAPYSYDLIDKRRSMQPRPHPERRNSP